MIRLPVAEAIPLAPALAWGLLDLLALVAFVVCIGLLFAWRRTIGAAFNRLARISILGGHPLGFLGDLSHSTESYLSQAAAATEHALVYMFHQLVGSIQWAAQVTAGLAVDTYDAIRSIGHATVTNVTQVVKETVVKPITRTAKATVAITRAQFNHLTHRVDVLAHRVASIARTTAGTIAAPFPRIGRIEKTVKAQGKRLTRVEKLLAGGLGVALLLRAMSKLGLGWLRCSNVNKAGKRLCGMDADLLESLLGASLLLAGAISLRDLARELEEPTKLVTDGLHALIEEF